MRHSNWLCFFVVASFLTAACGSNQGNGRVGGGGSGGSGGVGSGGGGSGGGGSGGGDGPDGGGGDTNCGVQNFMLIQGSTPDLLIIQDKSGSMSDDANDMPLSGTKNAASKWMQMVNALEQVVQSGMSIHWGLMMFSNDDSCGAPTTPDVVPAAGTGAAIKTALDAASPGGLTPTTAGINNAVAWYQSGVGPDPTGTPHYLLVATDGEPNCAGGQFGGADDAAAIKAVQDAANLGYHTFVVGIGGNTGADATLTSMAQSGLEPNTTPGQKPYYSVSSTQDLVNVLNKIAGQLVSCSYSLMMPPPDPSLVTINGNGNAIPRDPNHMNGWDFGPGNMSINFFGAACTQLQQGVITTVDAVFGCPPVN
jgi:hypothetical protein